MWLPEQSLLGGLQVGMHVIFDLVQFTNKQTTHNTNSQIEHDPVQSFGSLNISIHSLFLINMQ